MSLLDGRDTVTVYVPNLERSQDWGTVENTGETPVVVACSPQWQKPGQTDGLTQTPNTWVSVIAREWPGLPGCRFNWRGAWFEQVGTAKFLYGSARTKHFEVNARLIDLGSV